MFSDRSTQSDGKDYFYYVQAIEERKQPEGSVTEYMSTLHLLFGSRLRPGAAASTQKDE